MCYILYMARRDNHITVRISAEADAWLERRARRTRSKGTVIRDLIEAEMERSREQELLAMFNRAAKEVRERDRTEREQLLGAFAGRTRK